MRIHLLIASFFLLSIQESVAQKEFKAGYLLSLEGDTIQGYIHIGNPKSNSHQCLFKSTKNAEEEKFLPSDIRGYRIDNGKYFISQKIAFAKNSEIQTNAIFDRKAGTFELTDGRIAIDTSLIRKQVFLEFLVNGQADFFVYHSEERGPIYFVDVDNSGLVELKNTSETMRNQWEVPYYSERKEYVNLLRYLLRECEGIEYRLGHLELGNNSLVKLGKYYHNKTCESGQECLVYEKEAGMKLSIIPALGYSNLLVSEATRTKAFNYEFNGHIQTAGILFNMSNFQYINPKFFTQIGLLHQNAKLETTEKQTTAKITSLQVPFRFNYLIIDRKLQPHVGLGFNVEYRTNYDLESNHPTKFYELKKLYWNFTFTGGINFMLGEKVFLFNNVQAVFGPSPYFVAKDKSDSKNITGTLGVGIHIN